MSHWFTPSNTVLKTPSTHPQTGREQTQTGEQADADPTDKRSPSMSAVDFLDQLCCPDARHGDVVLQFSPQRGDALLALRRKIAPSSCLHPLHSSLEFPEVGAYAIDQLLVGLFQGKLTQTDHDKGGIGFV